MKNVGKFLSHLHYDEWVQPRLIFDRKILKSFQKELQSLLLNLLIKPFHLPKITS